MKAKTRNSDIIIITAPSGCGKTTLIDMLLKGHDDIEFSISTTTREPRFNEKHGINYYFVNVCEFKEMIDKDSFVEWANVHRNYYGTTFKEIERILDSGKKCLLDVDVQGGMKLMKIYPGCKSIFIEPPSMKELERRLRQRNTDNPEIIEQRMQDSEKEMLFRDKYKYRVVNDDLKTAYNELEKIIYEE